MAGLIEKMLLKKALAIRFIAAGLAASLMLAALSACDEPVNDAVQSADSTASVQHNMQQQVRLLDDHFIFLLPSGLTERDSQSRGEERRIAYASADGQQSIIVIISAASSNTLETMASRLQLSQQQRDPQLQVIRNQQLTISNHSLWRFDSLLAGKTGRLYSSVVFGEIAQQLLTMQVMVPVADGSDNQLARAEQQADKIVHSIMVK